MAKKKEVKLPNIPTDEDVRKFLATFNLKTKTGYRNYLIYLTMIKSGMRINEVLSLKYKEITEFKTNTMEVAYYYRLSAKQSKNKRAADIPIHPDLYKHYIELSKLYGHRQHGYIFTSVSKRGPDGLLTPLDDSYTRKLATRHSVLAGLKTPLRNHSCRHWYATNIYTKTGDILLVKEALRHQSINSTMVYTHIRPENVRKATELVDF